MATASTPSTQTLFDPALKRRLGNLRRRWLTVGTISAIVWGVFAAVGLLLIAAWLDLLWELSPQARWMSLRLAIVAGVSAAILVIGIAHRSGSRRALARRLDQIGATGGEILSGLDLMHYPVRGPVLTDGLSAMAIERAGKVSQGVPGRKVVPLRWIKISFLSLLMTAAVVVLVGFFLPRLAQAQWLRFTDPYGDHPPFSRVTWVVEPGDTEVLYASGLDIYATSQGPEVDQATLVLLHGKPEQEDAVEELPMFREADGRWRAVLVRVTQPASYYVHSGRSRSPKYRMEIITVPRLEEVRFRVTPPTYTQLGPYEGPLPEGGLSGLPGAQVEIWARSNRPLSGGTLAIEGGDRRQELSMQPVPDDSSQVTARFEIQYSGKFRLNVEDVDGQQSLESFGGAIHVLDDHRPFVRLMQPRKRSLATPNVMLPVSASAEDDYGISRLELFRSLNDSRALPQHIAVDAFPRRADERLEFPLSTYGLRPGDEIKLYARVEDNDPTGAKGSESDIVTVEIISEEEYRRMLQRREGLRVLMSKYREIQRRMANLAEAKKRLKKEHEKESQDKDTESISNDIRKRLRKLSEQHEEEIRELRRLARDPVPLDLEKSLADRLKRLTRRLREQQERLSELAENSELSNRELAEALEAMLNELEDERTQYEQQVMVPLEVLEKVYPLIEDQARFIEIVRRQRSLAVRLESLKGHDNEDDPRLKRRLRDFEDEQFRVREALVQLLDDIDNHVTELPEDDELDSLRKSAIEFVEAVRTSGAIEAMAEAELALSEFSGTRGHAKAKEAAEILEKFVREARQMAGEGASFCKLKFQPGEGIDLGNTIEQLLAGLGLLPGQGGAGGGGYSTRRSTMDNVGLYGGNPRLDDAQQGDGSGEENAASAGRQMATAENATLSEVDPGGTLRATGQGQADVPVRYRRRAGAYLRRIADELGE